DGGERAACASSVRASAGQRGPGTALATRVSGELGAKLLGLPGPRLPRLDSRRPYSALAVRRLRLSTLSAAALPCARIPDRGAAGTRDLANRARPSRRQAR